ncbi:MAG: PrsW family glutamic-type intramembrane protease [Oscillospiraceae bacterium]|nr:PrsW family glutamic-type intramembrane protease [Oscillospiraceae bacterium]
MFFVLPMLPLLAVYILAAVLPAILLLRYIYQQDTVEKEPLGLLLTLLLLGVAAALVSGVLERLAQTVLTMLVDPGSPVYTILLAFLVVALVEEGAKFYLLMRRTWYHPAFNYRFDGIVYAVFVSLGFAAFENIQYVLHYGLSVALPRALLAVPGHMSFAVYMGLFYGRAKLCETCGDEAGRRRNLAGGYLAAVLLHGIYDSCAMIGSTVSLLLFVVFVLLMYRGVYRLLKRESATDAPV